jgi:uncharacterized protein
VKVQETFEIRENRQRVWEFFNQPEQVAACLPGVESVEAIDADNLRVQLTQHVGPMTATFALKMSVQERIDNEAIEFSAVGRAVRGAAGSVRSTNRVELDSVGERETRVTVDADIAMGGMLGSVGQKVVSQQAEAVTRDFAQSVQRALAGDTLPSGRPEPARAHKPGERPAGLAASIDASQWRLGVGVLLLTVIAWLLGRNAGTNAAYARLVKKGYLR